MSFGAACRMGSVEKIASVKKVGPMAILNCQAREQESRPRLEARILGRGLRGVRFVPKVRGPGLGFHAWCV
jgi:hypothetical protein